MKSKKTDSSIFKNDELEARALLEMQKIKDENRKVAIALSGGADSVFALFVCAEFFGSKNCVALHFNHNVRETALRDELFAKSLCENLGVKFISGTRTQNLKKITEETLRELRHKFFQKACEAQKISHIVVAHIKDDIAETMLMRLLRGSSLRGLCAPKSVSKKSNLTYLRPLLNFEKSEIKRRLQVRNIDWEEDETNAQCLYLRNKMRHIILPELQKISERNLLDSFARSRKLLEEDETFLSEIFESSTEILSKSKIAFVDKKGVPHSSILRRAISALESNCLFKISASACDKFIEDCKIKNSAKTSIKNGFLLFDKKLMTLEFIAQKNTQKYFQKLELGKNKLPDGSTLEVEKVSLTQKEFDEILSGKFDESKIAHIRDENLTLFAKNIEKNDAYTPLGCKCKKTVFSQMSAKKTPVLKRKSFPLVCLVDNCGIWAPTLAPCDSQKLLKKGQAIRLTYIEKS